MDTTEISLKYEDLFDSKTRLKELFDNFAVELGRFEYKTQNVDRIHYTQVMWKNRVVGKGKAPLKIKAEQIAAADALQYFGRMNYRKPIPEAFQRLCT